jgi:hypothetical protein
MCLWFVDIVTLVSATLHTSAKAIHASSYGVGQKYQKSWSKLILCMATTVQHLQTQQAAVSFTMGSGRLDTVVLFDSNLFSLLMKVELVCLQKQSEQSLVVCLLLRLMTFFNGTDSTATLGHRITAEETYMK